MASARTPEAARPVAREGGKAAARAAGRTGQNKGIGAAAAGPAFRDGISGPPQRGIPSGQPPSFLGATMSKDASRWFKNGDHPLDACEIFDAGSGPFQGEGKVVRYYRRPDDDENRQCERCGNIMHLHGWIDTLEGDRKSVV